MMKPDEAKVGGKQIYLDWETSLSDCITDIYVRAISPEAEKFWTNMGFKRCHYEAPDVYQKVGSVGMIKIRKPVNNTQHG